MSLFTSQFCILLSQFFTLCAKFVSFFLHSLHACHETLFIDDREENCEAAQTVGIKAMRETTGVDWTKSLVDDKRIDN